MVGDDAARNGEEFIEIVLFKVRTTGPVLDGVVKDRGFGVMSTRILRIVLDDKLLLASKVFASGLAVRPFWLATHQHT